MKLLTAEQYNMTTPLRQFILKRGNTAVSSTYTGPAGEITYDTTLNAVRVHDGITAGGNLMPSSTGYTFLISNVTILQGNVVTLFSNAAAQGNSINLINANIGAYQIYANANAATQTTEINSLRANITAANTLIPNLSAVSGNILPSANVTYSLGNEQFQWRDLWVSNNTIYIGNTPVRVHNGNLLVNNTSIADTISKLTNGAYTFDLFANGQSRSPDTVFASNGVSILGANNTIQGGMYNSGDADWFNIGASTGRGFKFYVNEEDAGPLFFANGSANVPNTLYSTSGVIGDVGMYGGTIWGNNPNWNYLTVAAQIEGYSYVQIPSDATANVGNLRIHNDIGNIEIATGDGITYYNSYFTRYGELKLSNGLVFDINGSINATGGTAIFQSTDYDLRLRANTNGTMKEWGFSEDGTLTFPTSGNVVFNSSSTSIIDGVTDINAVGTIGANVIQVLSDLTSFGASPAPRIYGFSSIATTGSAVNEGNISASGNLVASRGAFITGNLMVSGNASISNIAYTPTTSGDWAAPAPTTLGQAIDRLATLVKTLNGGTGA